MSDALAAPPIPFPAAVNRLLTLALTQRDVTAFLREALDEALRALDGLRAFIARIEPESGELVVIATAGAGWTAENTHLRLQLHNATQRGITGYVAITGEPYISPDVSADPRYLVSFADVRSEAAVPFFDAEGRVRGVLNVESERLDHFRPEHATLLSAFANAIGMALASEEYRNRERMLVEIGLELASTPDTDALLHRVVAVASDVLRCEDCSVFLLDNDAQTLILRAALGHLREYEGRAYYRLGEGLTGSVAQSGEAIRLADPHKDPRWLGKHAEFSPDEIGAMLIVPVVGRERILGVLRVSRPKNTPAWFHGHFNDGDERVLRTVGSQLGTAIENAQAFTRLVRSERMAAWGELSARSAHMIGNRTFAIKGDLNELKYLLSQCATPAALAEPNFCAEVTALVDSVERGVYRLEEILREFRDFVMATQLTLQSADINQVIQETLDETFPKRSPVTLQTDFATDLPLLACDAPKLKRAFGELIENAVSFMPEGGTLRVTTTPIAPGQGASSLRLSPARHYVEITFADTGPGVPEDLKQKIFTPFYTSRVKGMGLGLSIVKGIIDAHHGVIREVGTPGQGATFVIYLPEA